MSGSSLIDQLEAPPAGGPAWLDDLRRQATKQLRATGLPHRKVEAWRFTPVASVLEPRYVPAAPSSDAAVELPAGLVPAGASHLVVLDGVPLLSSAVLPKGVQVESIAAVLEQVDGQAPAALRGTLGRLSSSEYFSALNAALFCDGLWLRLPAGLVLDAPLHIIHLTSSASVPTSCYPRVVVELGPGASMRLVERFIGRAPAAASVELVNGVAEIVLGADSNLEHVRTTEGVGHHVFEVTVEQRRDSRYHSRVFALGGSFSRVDLCVRLVESGAECELDGAYHVTADERVDFHTVVEHIAPHCRSHERYRGVIDGAAVAIFDAIAKVAPGARGSEAHQENRNLLVSTQGRVHTKPHLEIENDEVACSHGATVGTLDEEQLFYLRSRAVGEDEARAMLTYAFLGAILDRVSDEALRETLGDAFLARLPQGESLRGLR